MPSLPDNELSCNSHLAALVAINIVTQVLDEAEDILNAAHDSGQTWHYVWRQKKGNGEFFDNAKNLGMLDIEVDEHDIKNTGIKRNDNVIVTSTPQKDISYVSKTCNENNFIGQGDEDIQMRNTDLQSSSMLINCLFDMSEVEQGETMEAFDDVDFDPESGDFLAVTIAKLVDSYVNLALNTVCGDVIIPEPPVMAESVKESNNSSYSLLSDAMISDDSENEHATFCIDKVNEKDLQEITTKDVDLYEKTFLTLNRDYDKYSEEDFPPRGKNNVMQEVELLTNKSCDNLASFSEPINVLTNLEATSLEVKVKNSLVKRCRLQGAKLMSRLRSWWWKQRLIGKRKGCRSGICPLSPKARNLAASLLDHRKLRSPSPMRTTAWKFNTVNEAIIRSYNTKGV